LQARAYDGLDYSDIASLIVKIENPTGGKGFIFGFDLIQALASIAVGVLLFKRQRQK
jgi:hypothetical protein